MHSNIHNPKSICLLRLSAIGDVCHAVATVQAIQKCHPQAEITWIIGKVEYQLLKGLPEVEFIIFDKTAGLSGYIQLKEKLKGRCFDILLHMQLSIRASLATLFIRAKEKWGFDKSRSREGQWAFTNRYIDSEKQFHVADVFFSFARAIGVEADAKPEWNMPISQSDLDWQKEHLTVSGKYIVISPAASNVDRNWLPCRYASFANYAHAQGFSVVLCGGPSAMEKKLAQEIASECDFEPFNLVGKTSLKQLLAVLKSAKMVLAPDTGPLHMAVTVGTPVIGLYVHSNPKRTGPYHCQKYVVSGYEDILQQQTGSDSQQHCWGKRVKGENLMALISVDEVICQFDKMRAEQRF